MLWFGDSIFFYIVFFVNVFSQWWWRYWQSVWTSGNREAGEALGEWGGSFVRHGGGFLRSHQTLERRTSCTAATDCENVTFPYVLQFSFVFQNFFAHARARACVCTALDWYNDSHCTLYSCALSVCCVIDGNLWLVLVGESQMCIRNLGKATLPNLVTIAIPVAGTKDQTLEAVVGSQYSAN